MLNLFLDLDDYFFGQGGACQLRNSSGVLGKPTPPLWTQGMSQGLATSPYSCGSLKLQRGKDLNGGEGVK